MSTKNNTPEKECRRVARQIWREEPDLAVEDMLERNEIKLAARVGGQHNHTQLLNWILPDATPHEELSLFRELSTWKLEEAVAIWLDINPFILLQGIQKHNPSFWNQAFHPNLRERFHLLLERATRSAIAEELVAVRDENRFQVSSHNFYDWAMKNTIEPNGDRPVEFFAELKKCWYAERIEDGTVSTPSKVDEKRNELIWILETIEKADPGFSRTAMPGRKADFHGLCRQLNLAMFSVSQSTFNDYLSKLCTFSAGARKTDYYQNIANKLG